MLLRLCRAIWDSDGGVLLFGLPNTVAHLSVGLEDFSMWLQCAHGPPFALSMSSRTALIPLMGVGCPKGGIECQF